MILLSVGFERHSQREIVVRIAHEGHHYDVIAHDYGCGWLVVQATEGMPPELAVAALRLAVERYPGALVDAVHGWMR